MRSKKNYSPKKYKLKLGGARPNLLSSHIDISHEGKEYADRREILIRKANKIKEARDKVKKEGKGRSE